jgi:hypothetical protein
MLFGLIETRDPELQHHQGKSTHFWTNPMWMPMNDETYSDTCLFGGSKPAWRAPTSERPDDHHRVQQTVRLGWSWTCRTWGLSYIHLVFVRGATASVFLLLLVDSCWVISIDTSPLRVRAFQEVR